MCPYYDPEKSGWNTELVDGNPAPCELPTDKGRFDNDAVTIGSSSF